MMGLGRVSDTGNKKIKQRDGLERHMLRLAED